MATDDSTLEAGWDAREKFTTEVVWRLHLFLDTKEDDLKSKYASLFDLFMCVVGFIKDRNNVRKDLEEIELMIYPPVGTPLAEIPALKAKANKRIRDIYMQIYNDFSPLLLPEKLTQDPNRAFAGYYPK